MSVPDRPVLRYYGGKWKLAKWIIGYFPDHRVYIEPYGGAGSVLLQKPRAYAEVYNDLDGEIVNVFRVLRNPTQARMLCTAVALTPFAREEFELTYLPDGDPIEQARRTIYRSFSGFGSNAMSTSRPTGFRTNTTRSGTTPAQDWAHYPQAIPQFVERLRGVVIENRPALDLIQAHDGKQTLIYADPPYAHETRNKRDHKNYRFEMNDDQHRELSDLLHSVQSMVIVSGYACKLYDDLYGDWTRVDKATHADGARDRVESLWISPSAKIKQPELLEYRDD